MTHICFWSFPGINMGYCTQIDDIIKRVENFTEMWENMQVRGRLAFRTVDGDRILINLSYSFIMKLWWAKLKDYWDYKHDL